MTSRVGDVPGGDGHDLQGEGDAQRPHRVHAHEEATGVQGKQEVSSMLTTRDSFPPVSVGGWDRFGLWLQQKKNTPSSREPAHQSNREVVSSSDSKHFSRTSTLSAVERRIEVQQSPSCVVEVGETTEQEDQDKQVIGATKSRCMTKHL